jgi:hypothetical protein
MAHHYSICIDMMNVCGEPSILYTRKNIAITSMKIKSFNATDILYMAVITYSHWDFPSVIINRGPANDSQNLGFIKLTGWIVESS